MESKGWRALGLNPKTFLRIVLGTCIMSFGMVNIHGPSKITEGGVLGMVLFCQNVLSWDPAIVSPLLDIACYALGLKLMGRVFLKRALVASFSFAFFYKIFSLIGPILPNLYNYPLIASVVGGIFIGIGCGMVVISGGAAGGDDALAMVISKKMKWPMSRSYLTTDFVVLLLSLAYIAPRRLVFSLLTTLVSSFLIGQLEIKSGKPAHEIEIEEK